MKKNLLIISLSLMLTINPSISRADNLNHIPTLAELHSACNDTLNSCESIRAKQKEMIQAQDDLSKFQRERINDLEKKDKSILNNPLLYFTLGLVTGVILIKK